MTATEARAPTGASRAGLGNRLYNGETRIDFIGRQRRGLLLSAAIIALGLVAILLQGLNFGIEFRGGTSWDVPADVSVGRVKTVMGEAGFPNAKVQRFTPASGDPFVRASAKVEGKDAATRESESLKVRDKLATLTAGKPVSTTVVGPSWGNEITKKARNALIVFFLVIAGYLAIRFEWRMAVAALAAVVHDILVTIGIYALSGLEVTPASVIAFLTILGYSLYDTVVVFDRVDENAKVLASTGRATYSDVVNLSMNQTLMRSLNTSLVAILPILSVLVIGTFVLGATTLRDFGMALFIGLVTGAYSSIFIASPLLAWLKEREPRYRQLRARLEQRGGTGVGLLSPAGAARAGLAGSGAGKAKPVPARLGGGAAATAKAKRASGGGATATKTRSGASTAVLKPAAPAKQTATPDAVDARPEVDVAAAGELGDEAPAPPIAPRPSAKRPPPSAKAKRPPPPSYKKASKKAKRAQR